MKMLQHVLCIVGILLCGSLFAKELIAKIDWKQMEAEKKLISGEMVPARPGDPGDVLRLSHSGPGPVTLKILILKSPAIQSIRYALVGKIKYEGVRGKAFLEMWNHFPDVGRYFSRTLAEQGPMGVISGDSNWRDWILPFLSKMGVPPPSQIELNLVLPDAGTVHMGPLELFQYEESENPF